VAQAKAEMTRRRAILAAVLLLVLAGLLSFLRNPPDLDVPKAPGARSADHREPEPSGSPEASGETETTADAAESRPGALPGNGPPILPEPAAPVAGGNAQGETTTVRGSIRTADGKLPERATVRMLVGLESGFLTRTKGVVRNDGTFEIPGVAVAEIVDPLKLDVGAKGYLEETYKVSRAAFEEGRIEIVLRRPVTISGRLVDEAGKPVAGTDIHYFHGPYVSESGRSDGEGRFKILSPVNVGLAAYMSHRAHPRGILRWPPTDRDLDIGDVLVRSGRPVRGRVVGPEGKPVPGQLVVLFSGDRFGRSVGQTKTGATGEFVFANLGAGPFEVFATAGSDAEGRPLAARVIDLTPGHEPVTLTLHPMVRLTIRFLDHITRKPVKVVGPTCRILRHGDPVGRSFLRQGRGHFKEYAYLLDAPATYDIVMSCAFRRTVTRKGVRLEEGQDRTIDLEVPARRRH
jgi:hypothetical protein